MENKNASLGKINKKHVYLNHGKYGPYLTHDEINYKIPEWFPHEMMNVDIADRLITFKKKISEQWLEKPAPQVIEKKDKKVKKDKKRSESEEEYHSGTTLSDDSSEDEKEKINKRLSTKKHNLK